MSIFRRDANPEDIAEELGKCANEGSAYFIENFIRLDLYSPQFRTRVEIARQVLADLRKEVVVYKGGSQ